MLKKPRQGMKRANGEQGFTLVELIVVLAILALLAGLALPKFSNILGDSKTKAHNTNLRLIEQAAELYYTQTSTEQAQSTISDNNHYLVIGNYLREAPTNPLTNTKNYRVTIDASGNVTVNTP